MTTLEELAAEAIRYGMVPSDVGNMCALLDQEFIGQYLRTMQNNWTSPENLGKCTEKHRRRATKAWAKVITQVQK